MKFEFDSNNHTELRAVEAAVAMLIAGIPAHSCEMKDVLAEMKDLPGAVVSEDGLTVTGSGTVETIRVDTLEAVAAAGWTTEQVCEHFSVPIPEAAGLGAQAPTDEQIRASYGVPSSELDSAGQPWDAELHSSSRAKIADGTWKKKRGARTVEMLAKESGLTTEEVTERLAAPLPPATSNGELPDNALIDAARGRDPVPTPPAPPATDVVTMNQIWALITNNQATLNDVSAAAQRMGFADLGAVAQTATNEQRAALLKDLTV